MEMESRITYSFSFPARAGTKVPKRFLAILCVQDADYYLATLHVHVGILSFVKSTCDPQPSMPTLHSLRSWKFSPLCTCVL